MRIYRYQQGKLPLVTRGVVWRMSVEHECGHERAYERFESAWHMSAEQCGAEQEKRTS